MAYQETFGDDVEEMQEGLYNYDELFEYLDDEN